MSGILKVAGVTIANGGDNIGIYIPFFASNTVFKTMIILIVFVVLVALWLFVSYKLVKNKLIAKGLEKFGHVLVPIVFIGIGIYILSGTIKYFM